MYSLRARVAPALLALSPVLALGIAVLPFLPGANKLWSLLSFGVTTYGALVARKEGNRVQPELWAIWGGQPATAPLRFRSDGGDDEVARRHATLEVVLGGGAFLPTRHDEMSDPGSAEMAYSAAVRRLIGKVRDHPKSRLLHLENRNYGYARNLYGLKPLGLRWTWIVLVVSLLALATLGPTNGLDAATPFILPGAVSSMALFLWRNVDPDFVRPSADAYVGRLFEVLDDLAEDATREA